VANEAVALIALPLLVALNQWVFTLAVAHVDPHLVPAASRRRVRWLVAHSARIYLAAAVLVTAGLALQVAALLR
jgi:hypothetical protein